MDCFINAYADLSIWVGYLGQEKNNNRSFAVMRKTRGVKSALCVCLSLCENLSFRPVIWPNALFSG